MLVLFMACGESTSTPRAKTQPEAQEDAISFRIDGTLDFLRESEHLLGIEIEIADTDSSRERGMMQREAFPDRTGMLFLFDTVEIRNFWMANTPLALDLLFIGPDSQIVDIAKYARPFSDDLITSSAAAQYVLEVPAGFTDTHGITEGDRVRWQRN
jgi:uncharacterized membrane protein (UPF0127 family)